MNLGVQSKPMLLKLLVSAETDSSENLLGQGTVALWMRQDNIDTRGGGRRWNREGDVRRGQVEKKVKEVLTRRRRQGQ